MIIAQHWLLVIDLSFRSYSSSCSSSSSKQLNLSDFEDEYDDEDELTIDLAISFSILQTILIALLAIPVHLTAKAPDNLDLFGS